MASGSDIEGSCGNSEGEEEVLLKDDEVLNQRIRKDLWSNTEDKDGVNDEGSGEDDKGSWSNTEDEDGVSSEGSSEDDEETCSTKNRFQEDFGDITKIGKGGCGTVFKAKNKVDDAFYAVKRIKITGERQKELREATRHTALSHPNVVRYFSAWIGEKTTSRSKGTSIEFLYIQMELCDKVLSTSINEGLYLDEHCVWQYFREITEGLSYLHSKNLFHRDLKPDNIFLTSTSRIKIGDFGLATSKNTVRNQEILSRVGTPLYAAPEVLNEESMLDTSQLNKLDIYSLGVIFFEMNYRVCGSGAEKQKVFGDLRHKDILPDDFLGGNIHAPQRKVLSWLLKQDPKLRPSADEILNSPLLPALPEEEQKAEIAISKIVKNPECRLYKLFVEKLFEPPAFNGFDDSSHACLRSYLKISRRKSMVEEVCRTTLTKHGAKQLIMPILFPISATFKDDQTVVRVMDRTGKVMVLAPDPRVSFIRFLSELHFLPLRRYTIDHVFHKVGITHLQTLECAFDILQRTSPATLAGAQQACKDVGPAKAPDEHETASLLSQHTHDGVPTPNASQVEDVEIIQVVVEILDNPSVLHEVIFFCNLNHVLLIEAVLLYVGVPNEKLHDTISILAAADFTKDPNMDDDYYSRISSMLSGGPTIDARVNELLKFKGSLEELSDKMKEILDRQSQASEAARNGLQELRVITSELRDRVPTLKCRIRLDLLTSAHYSSGMIFQVTTTIRARNGRLFRRVLAFGYRYDNLLKKLCPRNKNDILRGAGVSIYIDAVAKTLESTCLKRSKSSLVKQDPLSVTNITGIPSIANDWLSFVMVAVVVAAFTTCASMNYCARRLAPESCAPRRDLHSRRARGAMVDLAIPTDAKVKALTSDGSFLIRRSGKLRKIKLNVRDKSHTGGTDVLETSEHQSATIS